MESYSSNLVETTIREILQTSGKDAFVVVSSAGEWLAERIAAHFSGPVHVCQPDRKLYLAFRKRASSYPNIKVSFTDAAGFVRELPEQLDRHANTLFYLDAANWIPERESLATEIVNIRNLFDNASVFIDDDHALAASMEFERQRSGDPGDILALGTSILSPTLSAGEQNVAKNIGVLAFQESDIGRMEEIFPEWRSAKLDEDYVKARLKTKIVTDDGTAELESASQDDTKPSGALAVMPADVFEERNSNWKSLLSDMARLLAPKGPVDEEGKSANIVVVPMGAQLERLFESVDALGGEQIQLLEKVFLPLVERLDRAIAMENNLRLELLRAEHRAVATANRYDEYVKSQERDEKARENSEKLMRHIIADLESRVQGMKVAGPAGLAVMIGRSGEYAPADIETLKSELAATKAQAAELAEAKGELESRIAIIAASRWIKLGTKLGLSKLQRYLPSSTSRDSN